LVRDELDQERENPRLPRFGTILSKGQNFQGLRRKGKKRQIGKWEEEKKEKEKEKEKQKEKEKEKEKENEKDKEKRRKGLP